MSTEQRLRDAMEAIADPVEPGPDDWSRLQSALLVQDHHRFRNAALTVLAAAALVAGVLTFVAASSDEDPTLRVVPPATERGGADLQGVPRRVIAVARDGRVDLLETLTGRVVRRIAPGQDVPDAQPTASIDDRGRIAVYTSGALEGGLQTMFRVDLPNGTPRPIGRGFKPTLSPDGRRLAYTTHPTGNEHTYTRLVVRTFGSGLEQSWDLNPAEGQARTPLAPASWSPDSARLVYTVGVFPGGEIGILDLATDRSFDDATKVSTSAGGVEFAQPVFRGHGQLVVTTMSRLDIFTGAVEPNRVLVIDPTTGRELERIFEDRVSMVTFDPTGRHMLYLGLGLMRRSDSKSTWIADGYQFADW